MTLEQLIIFQREESSGHIHLVELDEKGWKVAHTQDERDRGQSVMDQCDLNFWLSDFSVDDPPGPPGIYAALNDYWEGWELIPYDDGHLV